MTRILGIDVGGTFTDFVYHDPSEDKLIVWKTLSTPQDPGKGILDGLQNQRIGGVDYLRFGTTIATNAILERNGATVAFVTTSGFKDVPFIQRGKRQSHYDINWIKSKPLVKKEDTALKLKSELLLGRVFIKRSMKIKLETSLNR